MLDLPGARDGFSSAAAAATKAADGGTDSRGDHAQGGVVGETLPTQSLLASAASTVGGPLVIGLVLGGLAMISFGPRSARISPTR